MSAERAAELLAEARAFVAGPGAEWTEEIERTGEVPRRMWEELGRLGFLRLTAPESFGGHGLSLAEYLPILEAVSHLHGSLRMIVHVTNGVWRPILRRGTAEQAERFVRPQVAGESVVAFTLTEPGSGSGADIQATARREGEEYVLNGEKHLITFGLVCDYYLLICRLEGSRRHQGTLALMVPRHAPGMSAESMAEGMGLRGTDHARLVMRECRVPAANRIGEEGEGLDVAFRGFLDPSRVCVGTSCVGLAQRAVEVAVARARERVTFDRPIAERQAVRFLLAEAATDVEAARQLCEWAARVFDERGEAAEEAAKAKLFALEALQRVTDRALQVWGGAGYFKDSPIERIYRDARAQRFEEGTAESQKATIAKHLLG